MFLRSLLLVLGLVCAAWAQQDWNDPFPPHKVADNIYYVGTKGLSSYLITTKEGHILINPSFDRSVPLIRASVEKLGFRFNQIKILLNSHAHNDHAEGLALAKEFSGGKVYVMKGDEQAIESGGIGQLLYKDRWKPVKIDHVMKDGEVVALGEVKLTARRTAGHTRGCTTFTMKTTDKGKPVNVVVVGSPNVNPGYILVNNKDYPEIARDFEQAFAIWKSLPCDIFLGAHGLYYDLEAKYAKLGKSDNNPFIDPAGYKAYIEDREQHFRKVLAEQSKKGQ